MTDAIMPLFATRRPAPPRRAPQVTPWPSLLYGVLAIACIGVAHADHVALTATPLDASAFRIDVTLDASTPAPPTGLEHAGLLLELDPSNASIRLFRVTDTTSPLWSGRIQPLAQYGRRGGPGIDLAWHAFDNEAIYGLGERFDALDQVGRKVEMWIRDAPGAGPDLTSSYFCTPVLYSSCGYALAATDNPEGEFDLAPDAQHEYHYRRIGTRLSFFLILGDDLRSLLLARGRLQGPFRGIPDWAWGPWISRNSFETQAEAVAVLNEMIRRDWPVAAIVQEAWKGTSESGNFHNFSPQRWPQLADYFALCRAHNIQTVLWQVPILHPSSPQYAAAEKQGYLVCNPAGQPRLRTQWLAGFANVDFTNPGAVAFWQQLMSEELSLGVRALKADDGEDIQPDDLFYDGRRGDALHNEYPTLYNASLTALFDQRHADGLLWARSGSLGIERTPALWAGDQLCTWPQLASLLPAGLSTGLSGMPFWGHDIGGYVGTPTPELYIRWLQFGAFSPLMQYHGNTPREPWLFGRSAEEAYALLLNLRQALRPTLIALGREAATTGLPIMRPMALEFPGDARFIREQSQYMLGPDLLVAPVVEQGATGRTVLFPAGTWQHLLYPLAFDGPAAYEVPVGLVDAPVFVREGAELLVQSLTETLPLRWAAEAPQRSIRVVPERALIRNLRVPVFADALSRRAPLEFELGSALPQDLVVFVGPPGDPLPTQPQSLTAQGRSCSFTLPVPDDTGLLTDRTQPFRIVRYAAASTQLICAGQIRWVAPLTLTISPGPTRLGPVAPCELTTCVANRSSHPVDALLSANFDSRLSAATTWQRATLAPHERATWKWSVQPGASDSVASAPVTFELRADGASVATATRCLAPDWRWIVVGPFPTAPRRAHGTPFGPAWISSPSAGFNAGPSVIRWTTLPTQDLPHPGVDFAAAFGDLHHVAAYALTRLASATDQDVTLYFGSDDTLRVWLNGERIYDREVYRAAEPDQDAVRGRLHAGTNTLLVKVAQDIGSWRFYVRVARTDGAPLAGVTDGFTDYAEFAADRPPPTQTVPVRVALPWQVAGPYGPEVDTLSRVETALKTGTWPPPLAGAAWQPVPPVANPDPVLDLVRALGPAENATSLAIARIYVAADTPAELTCGSDDGLTLWLNGQRIVHAPATRAFDPAAHRVPVVLHAGENRLVACVRQVSADWLLQVLFWDTSQLPWRLVDWSATAPADPAPDP